MCGEWVHDVLASCTGMSCQGLIWAKTMHNSSIEWHRQSYIEFWCHLCDGATQCGPCHPHSPIIATTCSTLYVSLPLKPPLIVQRYMYQYLILTTNLGCVNQINNQHKLHQNYSLYDIFNIKLIDSIHFMTLSILNFYRFQ